MLAHTSQSAPLMIGVAGMSFVMMDGGIDISAGSNMYLSAAVCGLTITALHSNGVNVNSLGVYILIFVLGAFVGALIGCFNGLLIATGNMVPFIVTLIMTSIARGVGMFITGADLIIINNLGFKLADKTFLGISVLIYMAAFVLIIFHLVLRYSKYGIQLKAQGNNHEAAKQIGFSVRRNTFIAYVIAGSLAGLAGIMSAGSSGSIPTSLAIGNEFIIIPAAVLGGTSLFGGKGSIIPGAIIGMLLVNTIVNGLTMMNANPYVYTIVRGIIIFIAVMVDSLNYKGELR
jgi:ribose/xylose/arabinose/galactoside ABC-type transport system permease subunit